jgi:hypothetical protein
VTDQQIAAPEAPAIPATAAEAGQRLDALQSSKDWTDKLLAGDRTVYQEWNGLHERVNRGDDHGEAQASLVDRVSAAMSAASGVDIPNGDVRVMHETADHLRSLGIRDGVIEEVLSGHEVTQMEFNLVKVWKDRAMRDPEFTKKYLSGDPDALQKMTLAAIVLNSNVKKDTKA